MFEVLQRVFVPYSPMCLLLFKSIAAVGRIETKGRIAGISCQATTHGTEAMVGFVRKADVRAVSVAQNLAGTVR